MPNPLKPEKSVVTTCAYCGVGCGFKAETRAGKIVRMTPWKEGKANHGHSCIKGRFAYDYYIAPDRVRTPLIRASIDDPWKPASWQEAFDYAASEFKRIQAKYGVKSVGAVSSSGRSNFGTWRDAEGRLVWGVNDFDEAAVVPYPLDLVRLATSVRLAPGVAFSNHDAASAIAAGYRKGLNQPRPTLLDENAAWMLPFVACTDEEREKFWGEVRKYPAAIPPDEVKSALRSSLPTDAVVERFASRRKGSGGLGRQRFVAVSDWRGGSVIREAKALAPSAWEWAHGAGGRPSSFLDIATGKYRSPDPFLRVHDGFILRRIAADSRKIDLGDNAGAKLNLQLLEAMGFDLGAIHAASEEQTPAIRNDLDARPVDWLHRAAKVATESVKEDYAAWAKLIPSMIAAFRDFLNVDHNAK